jgi:hypothetical protein
MFLILFRIKPIKNTVMISNNNKKLISPFSLLILIFWLYYIFFQPIVRIEIITCFLDKAKNTFEIGSYIIKEKA